MLTILVLACFVAAQVQPGSEAAPPRPAAPAVDAAAPAAAATEPFVQWAEPPGPVTPEETALLGRARAALDAGKTVSEVLVDPAFAALHPRTEFRELIATRAKVGPLTLAAPDEPGPRLALTLVFRDAAGAPVRDGLVYLYHTSAKGWYAATGAHVRATAGDMQHARLFGYGRTDEQGRLEVHTIRPAGYPGSELPAHVHLHLSVGGKAVSGLGEVKFDDDPRLTAPMREQARTAHDVIVKSVAQPDGSLRAEAVFEVQPGRG